MKILITGGKTATALKLKNAFEGSEILLADYGEMPNMNSNSYSFVGLGNWNADILAHNLLTRCLDNGIDFLLPIYEAEILDLAKSIVLFEEFGLKVLLPQKPQPNVAKFKDWCVFDGGEMLYASSEIDVNENKNLNGAYSFNAETGEFALISISNPS